MYSGESDIFRVTQPEWLPFLLTSAHNYPSGPTARFEEGIWRGHPAPRQGTLSPAPLIYQRISVFYP